MSGLLLEGRFGNTGRWTVIASLGPHDPPGSISRITPGGRDVIIFRCAGDHSVIERPIAGADWETGAQRVIATTGTEVLATLTAGQSYEADVVSDRGVAYTARWSHA